jgi:hypothetical protein
MKLNIVDRLLLLNILPTKGNILTLRLAREFSESLSFTEAEHKVLNFVETAGNVSWNNPKKEMLKEIHVGEVIVTLIKDELTKLSDSDSLEVQHIDLYNKFFE